GQQNLAIEDGGGGQRLFAQTRRMLCGEEVVPASVSNICVRSQWLDVGHVVQGGQCSATRLQCAGVADDEQPVVDSLIQRVGAIAGGDSDVERLLSPFAYVSHCRCFVEAPLVGAGSCAQVGDARHGDRRIITAGQVCTEDLTAEVAEIEEVRDAVEIAVDNGDGARNGPFHGADVGRVAVVPARGPDQFASQGVDYVDAVAHRIGCRAVGVLVMVIRAVATAEYQCRYRLAAGPDLGQGRSRPGLPESGEAAGFRAYLPQHLRRVRIGNVKGIV